MLLEENKFIHYICSNRIIKPDGTYIEDETGREARKRRILFGKWFKEYEFYEEYTKEDFHVGKGTELENYMGFVFKNENPKIDGYREDIVPFINQLDIDK
ncbi:MAG: hypothetical protein WED10_09415 [Brumimicrobium sp.]